MELFSRQTFDTVATTEEEDNAEEEEEEEEQVRDEVDFCSLGHLPSFTIFGGVTEFVFTLISTLLTV